MTRKQTTCPAKAVGRNSLLQLAFNTKSLLAGIAHLIQSTARRIAVSGVTVNGYVL